MVSPDPGERPMQPRPGFDVSTEETRGDGAAEVVVGARCQPCHTVLGPFFGGGDK